MRRRAGAGSTRRARRGRLPRPGRAGRRAPGSAVRRSPPADPVGAEEAPHGLLPGLQSRRAPRVGVTRDVHPHHRGRRHVAPSVGCGARTSPGRAPARLTRARILARGGARRRCAARGPGRRRVSASDRATSSPAGRSTSSSGHGEHGVRPLLGHHEEPEHDREDQGEELELPVPREDARFLSHALPRAVRRAPRPAATGSGVGASREQSSAASRRRSRSGRARAPSAPSTASEITPGLLGDHDDGGVRLLGQAQRGPVARAQGPAEPRLRDSGRKQPAAAIRSPWMKRRRRGAASRAGRGSPGARPRPAPPSAPPARRSRAARPALDDHQRADRLAASASTARTTSSMSWRRSPRPPITRWSSRLRPAWASARRSSGWKRTMRASTQNAQKFSSTNDRLRRSACRATRRAAIRSPSPAASGWRPCPGTRGGRGRARRRRWRCPPGRARANPAHRCDMTRSSPRPHERAHPGTASRMASATRTARRTAATSWTRTMCAPAITAIDARRQRPFEPLRRRHVIEERADEALARRPHQDRLPERAERVEPLEQREIVRDRLPEPDAGVHADRRRAPRRPPPRWPTAAPARPVPLRRRSSYRGSACMVRGVPCMCMTRQAGTVRARTRARARARRPGP